MTECDCGCGNEVGDQGFYSLHVIGAKNMYDQLYQEHKRTIDYYENRIVEIAKLKEEKDKLFNDYQELYGGFCMLESTLDEIKTLAEGEYSDKYDNSEKTFGICQECDLWDKLKEILAKHEDKK